MYTKHWLKGCHGQITSHAVALFCHQFTGVKDYLTLSLNPQVRVKEGQYCNPHREAKITDANCLLNPSILFQRNPTNTCNEGLLYKVHEVGATKDRKITESLLSAILLLAERQP